MFVAASCLCVCGCSCCIILSLCRRFAPTAHELQQMCFQRVVLHTRTHTHTHTHCPHRAPFVRPQATAAQPTCSALSAATAATRFGTSQVRVRSGRGWSARSTFPCHAPALGRTIWLHFDAVGLSSDMLLLGYADMCKGESRLPRLSSCVAVVRGKGRRGCVVCDGNFRALARTMNPPCEARPRRLASLPSGTGGRFARATQCCFPIISVRRLKSWSSKPRSSG